MIYAFHGALGEPSDWASVVRHLDHRFIAEVSGSPTVELWNLYHYLESTADLFAEKACLEARAARRPGSKDRNILLGYSLGGRLALQCLVRDPSAWDAAVIVSAHPGLVNESERQDRVLEDQKWAQMALEMAWPEFWELWCKQGVLANSPWSSSRPQAPSTPEKMAALLSNFSLGRQPDLRPKLKQLGVPVLWVCGEKDSKYRHLAHEAASLSAGFQEAEISSCGHRVLREQPESLASLIHTFLQRCFQAKN